jgi:hypothetical protein
MHKCLDIILQPLKECAMSGMSLQDPEGSWRRCYSPLAAYLADIPEARILAGVKSSVSHVTVATWGELGDPRRRRSRIGRDTLETIERISQIAHPWNDIGRFIDLCREEGLSGVESPFWRDWNFADPAYFLTPDGLHQWHAEWKAYSWAFGCAALTRREVDRRYAAFQPIIGKRSFVKGNPVTKLKQVTCHTIRDMQRFFLPTLDGTNPTFQRSMKALMIFRYLAQMDIVSTTVLREIGRALAEFHNNKWIIHKLGLRKIEGWSIPKLELMSNVIWSMAAIGASQQYSTETPESYHRVIKIPGVSGRSDDHHRICLWLDLTEKRRFFEESTLRALHITRKNPIIEEDSKTPNWLSGIDGRAKVIPETVVDYFALSFLPNPPANTFATASTAFHLPTRPEDITISDALKLYGIPDLADACRAFFSQSEMQRGVAIWDREGAASGSMQGASPLRLPFKSIRVWSYVRVQNWSSQLHRRTCHSVQLQAWHSSKDPEYPYGRYDTCVVSNNDRVPFTGHIDMDGK